MEPCIALYMNKDGNVDSFLNISEIAVFQKEGAWNIQRSISTGAMPTAGVPALRTWMQSLIRSLGDCRILAGGEMTGLPYQIFGQAGFSIFTIESADPAVLDGILSDVQQLEDTALLAPVHTTPVETGTPGVYALNLITLQQAYPEITSKMALLPFLKETPFIELHLRCQHVPPWILRDYAVRVQRTPGGLDACILKPTCERS